jgi:hypothetical protein
MLCFESFYSGFHGHVLQFCDDFYAQYGPPSESSLGSILINVTKCHILRVFSSRRVRSDFHTWRKNVRADRARPRQKLRDLDLNF